MKKVTHQTGHVVSGLWGERGGMLLAIVLVFSMALGACSTCVGGKVTQGGVPLQGVYVQLLDTDGNPLSPPKSTWTDQEGEYCFDGLLVKQSFKVSAESYGDIQVKDVVSGNKAASCKIGTCTKVDFDFACSPQDSLEPNNTCEAASLIDLPYSNPLTALCPAGDVDFYRFEVSEEGLGIVAQTSYPGAGRHIVTLIGLFDSQCTWLAGSLGYSYPLGYVLPGPGAYYVGVTGPGDDNFSGNHNEFGTYGLDIQAVPIACVTVHVNENGQPLQGATVLSEGPGLPGCITDSTGSCCLVAFEGIETRYDVYHPVSGDSLQVAVIAHQAGTCGQGACEEVTVDFDYTCVSGLITRDGQPVGGANVCGPYGCATTDSQGSYCVREPKGERTAYIYLYDPILCTNQYKEISDALPDGSCDEGTCTEMDLELSSLTCVSGLVTRDGEPVGGVWVSLPVGCVPFGETGPDGRFCFVAPADSEFSISVGDPLFGGSQDVPVHTGSGGSCTDGGCTEVEAQLTGVTCVSGTIRWGDEPAEGVTVSGPVGVATTGPDGTYCLKAPKGSDACVSFYDPIYGDYHHDCAPTGETGSCEEGGCTMLDFALPPTSCIHGTVTRADGQPAEYAEVCDLGGCVAPDPDGRYCLKAPVNTNVSVSVQDYVTGEWQGVNVRTGEAHTCASGPCAEANFVLTEPACVSGVVLRGSVPEEGAKVCLYYSDIVCETTGPQGEYCLPAPATSWPCIYVKDPILGEWPNNCVQTGSPGSCGSGVCSTLDFTLREATCISGVVRKGTGPLEGAQVSNEFASVSTNSEGRYCLPALANTNLWIRALDPADYSEITRYPTTGNGGRCQQGGCTTQNFTFDVKRK